ncbi:MAG: HD domain-containing protein, partial [Candidatus Zixiibacteriota bacterium]
PSVGFQIMLETDLLKEVLPELIECVGVDQPGGFHKYDVFEHTLYTIDECHPRLRLRLAALFHDITKPQHKRIVEDGATFHGHETTGARTAATVMKRLHYSNDLIDQVTTLVERHMFTTDVTDKGLRRLLRRVGDELIFDLLDLRRADVIAQGMGGATEDVDQFEQQIREELEREPPLTVSDLAINGHGVMQQFDLQPGPTVGRIMNYLLERVLDDPRNNTVQTLRALARSYYDEKIASKKENETSDTDNMESVP